MAFIGASFGGVFTAAFGVAADYVADSVTYLISAVLVFQLFRYQMDQNYEERMRLERGEAGVELVTIEQHDGEDRLAVEGGVHVIPMIGDEQKDEVGEGNSAREQNGDDAAPGDEHETLLSAEGEGNTDPEQGEVYESEEPIPNTYTIDEESGPTEGSPLIA